LIIDYHLHLRAPDESLDHTVEAVERFVDVAEQRGIDEIGFTEHVYYFVQTREIWWTPYQQERCRYDLERYVDAVSEAKRRGMPVKLGLEVDYHPLRAERMAEILEPYPWDYLLGSVHFVDSFGVDGEPRLIDEYGEHGAWSRYFAWLERAAGAADALAHPDLVKIFGGLQPPETAEGDYEGLVAACEAKGTALEVSSAGLHKPVGELYPDPRLLAAAHRRGVPITLASDGHVPQNVGRDLDRALEHAREAGYETITVFESRRSRQEPLG
jgi:histidinol-phosphatase (PHP family)